MRTIGSSFQSQRNNFDIIRMIAASLVLISHSFPLAGHSYEPFARLGGYETGGGFGVNAFIVISGFLICRSVERGDIEAFYRARFLRIVPALAVVTLLQVFIIGPLFTDASLMQYFSLNLRQFLNVFVFTVVPSAPTVFTDLPHGQVINGSLWTLPIEAAFYVVISFLFVGQVLRPARFWVVLVILAAGYYQLQVSGCSWADQCGMIARNLPLYSTTRLAVFFSIGAACWIYRDHIPLSPWIAFFALVALALAASNPGIVKDVFFFVCFSYLVVFFGCYAKVEVNWYEKLGDLSYGTYVFAWPVQQIVLSLFGLEMSPYVFAIIAFVPTLILAYASWNLVEKRALLFKK